VFDVIGPYIGMTLEQFEVGFMRDMDPESESALWFRITKAWLAYHEDFLGNEALPNFDAFQMKARHDPVVSKPEGEPGVVVEWDHPAFFFNRIIVSLSCLVMALIADSRFKAELRLGCTSCQTNLVGRRLRVYREAVPSLCCWQRRSTFFVMPV
jgi:hypothetical protein